MPWPSFQLHSPPIPNPHPYLCTGGGTEAGVKNGIMARPAILTHLTLQKLVAAGPTAMEQAVQRLVAGSRGGQDNTLHQAGSKQQAKARRSEGRGQRSYPYVPAAPAQASTPAAGAAAGTLGAAAPAAGAMAPRFARKVGGKKLAVVPPSSEISEGHGAPIPIGLHADLHPLHHLRHSFPLVCTPVPPATHHPLHPLHHQPVLCRRCSWAPSPLTSTTHSRLAAAQPQLMVASFAPPHQKVLVHQAPATHRWGR